MKNIVLLTSALLIATPAQAEPIAYPGSAWINVTGPAVGSEKGNWITTGRIQQGIDWTEVSGWRLNTATSLFVSKDTKGYEWNNKIVPSISGSMRKNTEAGMFEIGVQYIHEKHFGDKYVTKDRSSSGVQVFANYWIGWGR